MYLRILNHPGEFVLLFTFLSILPQVSAFVHTSHMLFCTWTPSEVTQITSSWEERSQPCRSNFLSDLLLAAQLKIRCNQYKAVRASLRQCGHNTDSISWQVDKGSLPSTVNYIGSRYILPHKFYLWTITTYQIFQRVESITGAARWVQLLKISCLLTLKKK